MNETNINRSRKAFKRSKFSPVWILSTLLVMSSTALALDCDDFNYSMHPQLESDAPELRLCDEAAGRVANPDLVFSSGVHLDQIDVMKAVRACQSAHRLEPENHRITFQLGFSLQLAENHSEALSVLSLASEGGYAPAMERIGWAFSRGAGFPKSEKAAFPWYYKAACGNDPWGLSSLGYAYVQGEGVTEDKPQGIDLIRQAAEADEPWALENYGGRLIKGNGVQQDGAQGLVMLERAAEAGAVSAQASLAWYLASDVYGIPVNDQKSNRYQKLAAEKGNASSQGNLGQALVGGWNGYSKDYVGGAYWSRRAAYHGTAWGVFKMADLYRIGAGVAKNAERAKTLYLKAAEKFQKQADGGRVISYHWLGLMHEKGYGFDANRDKAIEFYLTAARKKHPFSIKKLKRLGVPVPEPEE